MNDKVTAPSPSRLEDEGRLTPQRAPDGARREKAATRRKVFDLILLDALRGSRPYVESYRAGRGAE